jgi:peroxiredoxin
MLHVDQEESLKAVESFVKQYDLASHFLMDPDGKIGRLYELRGTPTTFFINPDGVIQDFQPGFVTLDWIEQNLNQAL